LHGARRRFEVVSNAYAWHNKNGKASFDHIYNLRDPREYFRTLWTLDYRAPQNGYPLFSTLVQATRRDGSGSEEVRVVDLCCSYGINGALLKYDVTLDDLYERYRSEELASLSSEELAAADAEFYGSRKRETPPRVVGVDAAENAVSYARRAGLIDGGFAENLEEDEPTDALRKAVSKTDLLIVTGGVGYVWERTFDRLLGCITEEGDVAWVATFPLRMVDYRPIAKVLSNYGLVTEKLSNHTFAQRRFVNTKEQEYVLHELASMGIDPDGKEATGRYHTDFYLSRPPDQASKIPIDRLLGASVKSLNAPSR
jgi:hypothetical protein